MLSKNKNNFNKNEYDILVDKEEIIIKNPEYDEMILPVL